jgi:hypothetical protein
MTNSAFMASSSTTIKEVAMTTAIHLTDTQRQVLEHAADQADGGLTWFPVKVKGCARKKVIDGLFNKGLITGNDGHDCFLAAEGYDALGRARPALATTHPDPEVEATLAATEAVWVQTNRRRQSRAPARTASKRR